LDRKVHDTFSVTFLQKQKKT